MKKIVKLQKWSNNIKHIISLIWWRVNTLHSTPIMCDSHTTIMNGVHKHIGYMSRKEWKKEMVTGRCYFPVIFDANCHSWFCDWMRRSTVVAVGVLRLVFDLHIFLYIALLCIFRVSCPSIPLLRGLIIPAFSTGTVPCRNMNGSRTWRVFGIRSGNGVTWTTSAERAPATWEPMHCLI